MAPIPTIKPVDSAPPAGTAGVSRTAAGSPHAPARGTAQAPPTTGPTGPTDRVTIGQRSENPGTYGRGPRASSGWTTEPAAPQQTVPQQTVPPQAPPRPPVTPQRVMVDPPINSEPQVVKSQPPATARPQPKAAPPKAPGAPDPQGVNGWGRVMGAASVVLGGYEMYQAYNDAQDGHMVEAVVKGTGGSLNTTAGVAYMAGATQAAGIAGGSALVIKGAVDLYTAWQTGDTTLGLTGGVETVSGGLLMSGNPAAMAAGTAMAAGWSAGRFIGGMEVGGKTVDDHVTNGMDAVINGQQNAEAQRISEQNRKGLEENQGVIGRSTDEIRAQGGSSKDVSAAILGMREQMEQMRNEGRPEDAAQMEAEVKRLMAVRGELATEEAQEKG